MKGDTLLVDNMEIIEITTDQKGTFIRFNDYNREEGFILIPSINYHKNFSYGQKIDIEIKHRDEKQSNLALDS